MAINFGMKVKVTSIAGHVTNYFNVTEMHHNYDGENKLALESDFHSTGITIPFSDIHEFEVIPCTEITSEFSLIFVAVR